MPRITWANNAASRLTKNLNKNATEIKIQHPERFPDITFGQEYFLITIEHPVTHEFEICKVIKSDKENGILYVERGQENTIIKTFPPGSSVENRITKGTLELLLNSGGIGLPSERNVGDVLTIDENNNLIFLANIILHKFSQNSLQILFNYIINNLNIDINTILEYLQSKNIILYNNFKLIYENLNFSLQNLYKIFLLYIIYFVDDYEIIGNVVEILNL